MTVRRRTEPLNGCLAHAQQSSSRISRNSFEGFTLFCLTQSNKHRFNSGVKKQIPISQALLLYRFSWSCWLMIYYLCLRDELHSNRPED
jgi:hypothetical protein